MEIGSLQQEDVNLLSNLQPPGWGDLIPVFDFYTKSDFCFPIKITVDSKIAGIGTAIIHHDTCWLAHIIVHEEHRNKGIGKLITETLVEFSQSRKCNTINLIATELGAPVYEKVGFETETEYIFFKDIKPDPTWAIAPEIKSITEIFLEQIIFLDKQISQEDRSFYILKYGGDGFVYEHENVVQGFYLPRFGEGLIVANNNTAGIELIKLRLQTRDTAAFPMENIGATGFLHMLRHAEFKKAKRMRLGAKREWQRTGIYNRIGGNLG
jgi:GNAT superfamily N-acetyltransferase